MQNITICQRREDKCRFLSRVEGKSYHLQENSYLKAVICRAFGGLSASEKERKNIWNGKNLFKEVVVVDRNCVSFTKGEVF